MTTTQTRQYAHGTSVTQSFPWGGFVSARALCPDGAVRTVNVAETADTFFSVPASVQFRGTRVSGFITIDESTPDPTRDTRTHAVVRFVANVSGRNAHLLPVNAPQMASAS